MNLGDSVKMKKGKVVPKPVAVTTTPKKDKSNKKDDIQKPDDPEFAEFLEIHSHKQKDMIWDNDGIDGSAIKSSTSKNDDLNNDLEDKIAHKKDLSDLEVCLVLPSWFVKN